MKDYAASVRQKAHEQTRADRKTLHMCHAKALLYMILYTVLAISRTD